VLSHLQDLSGEQPSPTQQLDVVLRLLLALDSRQGWLVLFLPMHDEGELRSHQLVSGVGLAHLPNLVLSTAGTQWILRDWTEEPVVPLRAQPRFFHTSPPSCLPVSTIFPTRCVTHYFGHSSDVSTVMCSGSHKEFLLEKSDYCLLPHNIFLR
jgi:hypothetical protein